MADVADIFSRDALAFAHQNITVFIHDIQLGGFAFQTACNQIGLHTVFRQIKSFFVVKGIQNLLIVITQRFKQNRYRHFAAAVDTEIEQVFRIKLKIQP